MSSSVPEIRALARQVEVTDTEVRVDLADGRRIAVPLVWFPRLRAATGNCWVTEKASTGPRPTKT